MKTEHAVYTTAHSTDRIAQAFRGAYGDLGAEISGIENPSSPVPAPDPAQIAIVGEGRGLIGGYWAVQAYVHDHGTERTIELVALGQSMLGRAWGGMRRTVSLSASAQKMHRIADALHTAVPDLTHARR